jgi:hypothetical protein
MGTWCERQYASVFLPSTSFGPVHPLGVRRMIIGQSGRLPRPPFLAPAWMPRISSTTLSSVPAMSWCMASGSSPSTW